MNRFWTEVIEPLARAAQPKIMVEVGSDYGVGTEKLLGLCKSTGALLHVVDPVPKYDADEWSARWGDSLVFHRELSLDALPVIGAMDFVLLDGDHNWYTVRHELEVIYGQTVAAGHPFPLILLHDVGWPYGRRDLYYDPDTIPEEFQQPHAAIGILPDHSDLVPNRGMNGHHFNALSEGTPRNGVRTGIEDFINDHDDDFTFRVLPVFFGLGILYRTADLKDGPVQLVLDALSLSPGLEELLRRVERERVDLTVAHHERLANYEVSQARVASVERFIQNNQVALGELGNKLHQTRNELDQTRVELADTRGRLSAWESKISVRAAVKLERLVTTRAPHLASFIKKVARRVRQRVNHMRSAGVR